MKSAGKRAGYDHRPMDAKTIIVLEGDETGQELLEEALRVLAPDVIGFLIRRVRTKLEVWAAL